MYVFYYFFRKQNISLFYHQSKPMYRNLVLEFFYLHCTFFFSVIIYVTSARFYNHWKKTFKKCTANKNSNTIFLNMYCSTGLLWFTLTAMGIIISLKYVLQTGFKTWPQILFNSLKIIHCSKWLELLIVVILPLS